jgi:hypothetical protein
MDFLIELGGMLIIAGTSFLAGYLLKAPEIREVEKVIERAVPVHVPSPAPTATAAQPTVDVVLMDANERKVFAVLTLDARQRRGTLTRGERKYVCSRQDDAGRWIYRQVMH